MKSITVNELNRQLASKDPANYIDVRTTKEFEGVHISNFENRPLAELNSEGLDKSTPTYVICAAGIRSQKASEFLSSQGFKDVINVEGGIMAWQQKGYPVSSNGNRRMPVIRQVHCIVGLGVLVGVIGTYFGHNAYLGVAAFFGAGMLFSGITGFCGMARVLELLPWNR